MRRAVLFVSTLVVLALAAFGGSAAAAPNPTPNEWVGACNMSVSWPTLSPGEAVGIQGNVDPDGDGGGMELAMFVDNSNGNDGMFTATVVSGGYCP
jgi:hypothetical protein